MKSKRTRFGWGGSLAFRRDLVDSRLMHLLSSSQYSVSDDISITKRAREKRMEIAYVDDAAPIVYTKETRSSFFEWANRQTALPFLCIYNLLKASHMQSIEWRGRRYKL